MRAAEPILVPLLFAVFLVVMGVLSVGIGFVLIIGTSLDDFSDAIPRYQILLTQKMAPIHQGIEGLGFQLNKDGLLKSIDPGASMKLVAKLLSGLGIILTNSFLIFLTVVFILLEASNFRQKIRIAFGDQSHPFAQYHKIGNAINHYLAIKTVVSLGTGVLVAIWVGALGVDFPLIWGLFAFLLNYIPNLGSIIAAVPPTLLGFIQFGIGRALLVAAGYIVVNMLFGNVVEPKLMGRTLGLSTLVVFLSLVFWGWVWGPAGMLLSVPLTMVVKIALESSPTTHWLSIMLDSESSVAKTAKDQEVASTG